uniref:Extracellular membrane protein CFEM domain-containing protein n=1 Tax=Phakopsora pachyrhizi TaxID=170000 RepID=A0A0S1MKF9_PHAPC
MPYLLAIRLFTTTIVTSTLSLVCKCQSTDTVNDALDACRAYDCVASTS